MDKIRRFNGEVKYRTLEERWDARKQLAAAVEGFLNGDPESARLGLRQLINRSLGFERLAAMSSKPAKSLHRMLSVHGNPSMENLAYILIALRLDLNVDFEVKAVLKPR